MLRRAARCGRPPADEWTAATARRQGLRESPGRQQREHPSIAPEAPMRAMPPQALPSLRSQQLRSRRRPAPHLARPPLWYGHRRLQVDPPRLRRQDGRLIRHHHRSTRSTRQQRRRVRARPISGERCSVDSTLTQRMDNKRMRKKGCDRHRPPKDWRCQLRSYDMHEPMSDTKPRSHRTSDSAPAPPSRLREAMPEHCAAWSSRRKPAVLTTEPSARPPHRR
jgi:hypothetical protein